MLLTDPQIAVQGLSGLAAKRKRPRSVTLAEHPHHPLIQVDVVNGHADTLGAAHAGINQQQDDGGVTPAGEVPAVAGLEEADELFCPDDTDGLLGEVGGFMPSMGLAWRSPSATAHLKKAWRLR